MAPSGMTGEQIYQNFYSGTGDDGQGLSRSATQVNVVAQTYEERARSIIRLTERMEASWQGPAAGAARRGAGPLAVEHMLAAPEIDRAQQAINDQVTAFNNAKATVTWVPPAPKKPSLWDNISTLGGAGDSYESQMNQVNAANDTNVAAMSGYESASEAARNRMPSFATNLVADEAKVGVVAPTPPPPPNTVQPPPSGTRPPGRTTTTPPGTSTPPGTGNPLPGTTDGVTGPGVQNQPAPTGQQNQTPGITTPGQAGPGFPGGPFGPGGQGGSFGPGGQGGPGAPFGPMAPMAPFGPGGSGGGYGPGGGARGFGPGGSGGPGAGGAGGSGSGPGARGAAGYGAGGGAAAEGAAGARGGAGAAGGRGPMGMGGGRGRGSEDAEHERPTFLVEPDPHDTFGTDEVTAPPVIGE